MIRNPKSYRWPRRLVVLGATAVLAAGALGVVALQSHTVVHASPATVHAVNAATAPVESTTDPDTDNIQSGDQNGPDSSSVKAAAPAKVATPAEGGGPDTDNVQSGDQTGPDSSSAKTSTGAGEIGVDGDFNN